MKFDVMLRKNDALYELVLIGLDDKVIKGLGYVSKDLSFMKKLLMYLYKGCTSDLDDFIVDDLDYIKKLYTEDFIYD